MHSPGPVRAPPPAPPDSPASLLLTPWAVPRSPGAASTLTSLQVSRDVIRHHHAHWPITTCLQGAMQQPPTHTPTGRLECASLFTCVVSAVLSSVVFGDCLKGSVLCIEQRCQGGEFHTALSRCRFLCTMLLRGKCHAALIKYMFSLCSVAEEKKNCSPRLVKDYILSEQRCGKFNIPPPTAMTMEIPLHSVVKVKIS